MGGVLLALVRRAVRDHPGLFVAALAAVVTAFRILAVSGFDQSNALVVMQVQGTSQVLLGTLLPAVPLLPMMVVGAVIALLPRDVIRDNPRQFPVPMLIVAIISGVFVPWQLGLLFIAPPAVGVIVFRWKLTPEALAERHRRFAAEHSQTERAAIRHRRNATLKFADALIRFGTAGPVLLLLADPTPWMPLESLTTPAGEHFVGYYVGDRGEDEVFLTREHRTILVVPRATTRAYCRVASEPLDGPSLMALITRPSKLPACS